MRLCNKIRKLIQPVAFLIPTIGGVLGCSSPIDEETLKTNYGEPLSKLNKQLNVYHLGHSLVGRDMPAMLKQLAGEDHDYRSQLGWGTRLKSHWEPNIPIKGFETENSHPNYQDVFKAIDSREYDAFVLTEGVEIKSSIKYGESDKYLAKFADYIKHKSPNTRLYLYETWHEVTDKDGWINRLNSDYKKYWLEQIVDKALLLNNGETPIYIIPVGQVMSAFFTALKSIGGVEGLSHPEDIFSLNDDGTLDPIHINDIGNYLVALVHYAVIYQKSPVGLPFNLAKANGSAAIAPSKASAELMQSVTWKVVSSDYRTGLVGY